MKHECTYAKFAAAAAAMTVALTACGKQTSAAGPGAEAGSPASSGVTGGGYGPSSASYDGGRTSAAAGAQPIATVDGKPMWAANRKHSSEENARYQFTRNGADFGAANESDYVRKVHAFIDHPPADVETLDRRNGDKLLYDKKANIFAVVSRDGAPRTMFRPRDGAAYWNEQKTRVSEVGAPGAGSRDNEG